MGFGVCQQRGSVQLLRPTSCHRPVGGRPLRRPAASACRAGIGIGARTELRPRRPCGSPPGGLRDGTPPSRRRARTVKIVLAEALPAAHTFWNEGQTMSSGRRRGHYDMTIETWRASTIIAAPAEAVFCRPRRPRDPPGHRRHRLGQQRTRHHATHWIRPAVPDGDVARQPSESQPRDDQPSGRVRSAASDLLGAGPGQRGRRNAAVRRLDRRYDLVATGPSRTEVTLTYDWTAVSPFLREHITFPPFPVDHLTNSLRHLAELVQQATPNSISARGRRAHGESPSVGASFDAATST